MFDVSAMVSAALREDSVPERALLRAEEIEVFALSAEVDLETAGCWVGRASPPPCLRRGVRASWRSCVARPCGSAPPNT